MDQLHIRQLIHRLILIEIEDLLKPYHSLQIIVLADVIRITKLVDQLWEYPLPKFHSLLFLQSAPALCHNHLRILRTQSKTVFLRVLIHFQNFSYLCLIRRQL